jgi:hypothetical protein
MQFLSLKFDSKVNCPVLNNPLKYIDPTGHVKVHPIDGGKPRELDVLSPIEGTYRSDNLFDFPESYERLKPEMQFLSLKFDSKVNCPVLKSIIFSNSLVGDGRERALIFNALLRYNRI